MDHPTPAPPLHLAEARSFCRQHRFANRERAVPSIRCPADRKAEVDDIIDDLLGQRGRVDDHAVDATRLSYQA